MYWIKFYSGELIGMNPGHATQSIYEALEYVGLKTKDIEKLEHSVLE